MPLWGFSSVLARGHRQLWTGISQVARSTYSSSASLSPLRHRLVPSPRVRVFVSSRFYSSPSASMKNSYIVKRVDNITKSAQDVREYRGLELSNGLRVLLVSDPKADKSAAALDVNVGHLMDNWELPGTAHFCEHMLFLGTDKYPSENEYSKFISSNGGSTNAYTSTDNTNYHFDVKPSELPGALDRFVQFFLAPQFTESATEREVCAVDSEHSNNLKNDQWRCLQIDRSLSKPGHDYGKFGTGNKQTLLEDARKKGIEPREALLEFHNKYYSSNIMALCVVGSEDLDTLQSYLGDLGFDKVENKNVERKVWAENPFGPEECGTIVEVVPIKDVRTLHLTFPFPDLKSEFRSQPAHYISHLIGHEGKGSLLSELKRRGWVTSLNAGNSRLAAGMGKFTITVDLSPEGVEQIDQIIELIFSEIGLVKRNGAQQWIQEELAELGEVKFRFKDKESPMSYATHIASELQHIPFEHVLSHEYLMDQYNPDKIEELLTLLHPNNMICRVVAKKFAGQEGNTTEPVYGTEMRVSKFTKEQLERYTEALNTESAVLTMPDKNDYIPTNFDLVERDSEDNGKAPRLIHDDNWLRVWFKQDDEFNMPKRITRVGINAPAATSDPRSTVLSAMFAMCLQDALAEETYNPHLAGLTHSIDIGFQGINIRVSPGPTREPSKKYSRFAFSLNVRGYNEKQSLFVRDLVHRLVTFKPDPVRFGVLKEHLRRSLRNFSHGQPYSLSQHYHLLLTAEKYFSKEQLLACSADLSVKDVEDMLYQMLRAFHVEVLVHGNATEKDALEVSDAVLKELRSIPSRPLFTNEVSLKREHALPAGQEYFFRHFQPTHSVSCVDVILQCGVMETRRNAVLELVAQCMQEHAFNVLRTNEQLGYIVHTGVRRFCGSQSLELLVQGPMAADHVEERVENYLQLARQSISDMPEEEFKNHIEALATKRLEKPKTLNQRFARFWSEIESQQYHFTRAEDEVEMLRTLTKDDVLGFFDEHIKKGAEQRRKLTVLVHGNNETREAVEEKTKDNGKPHGERREVKCMDSFRSGISLYPHPEPKMTIPPAGTSITVADFEETSESSEEVPKAKY